MLERWEALFGPLADVPRVSGYAVVDEDEQLDTSDLPHVELADEAADSADRVHRVQVRFAMADYECDHGRLAGDKTPPCGCWPTEPYTPWPATRGDELDRILNPEGAI